MTRSSNIFPLRISPFEHFCYALGTAEEAMTFWAVFTFRGKFDQERLGRAFQEVLIRHPLLSACIKGTPDAKTKDIVWINSPGISPHIDWGKGDLPLSFPNGASINLENEPGIQIFVREGEERTKLYLHFHHACCDGLRCFEIVDDLLIAYSKESPRDPGSVNLMDQDSELLDQRGKYRFGRRVRALMFLLNIFRILKMSRKTIIRLAVDQKIPVGQDVIPAPCFHSFAFDKLQFDQIRQKAQSEKISINDLFLAGLFLSLYQWNLRKGSVGPKNGSFRIAVPIDLNYALNKKIPSANKIGLIFLDRKAHEIGAPTDLFKTIHHEMKSIKKWKLGYSFIRFMAVLGQKEGRLNRVIHKIGFYPTILFSNLGPLFPCSVSGPESTLVSGDVELLEVETVAPTVPWAAMNLVLASYAGTLKMGLQFNPKVITAGHAKEFLQLFADQILSLSQP